MSIFFLVFWRKIEIFIHQISKNIFWKSFTAQSWTIVTKSPQKIFWCPKKIEGDRLFKSENILARVHRNSLASAGSPTWMDCLIVLFFLENQQKEALIRKKWKNFFWKISSFVSFQKILDSWLFSPVSENFWSN